MQITNNNPAVSFESRASIKKMLKLPNTGYFTQDINKFTGSLVDDLYKNKNKLGNIEFTQNNKKRLEKAKNELGNKLLIDENALQQAKDESFQIPISNIIKLIDIISENPKKQISALLPKINKIPALSNLLDSIKMLNFPMANDSFENIFLMVSGKHPQRKAVFTPLRKGFENTTISLNDIITRPKQELADSLKENVGYHSYLSVKNKGIDLIKQIVSSKDEKDFPKILADFQNLIKNLQKLSE